MDVAINYGAANMKKTDSGSFLRPNILTQHPDPMNLATLLFQTFPVECISIKISLGSGCCVSEINIEISKKN